MRKKKHLEILVSGFLTGHNSRVNGLADGGGRSWLFVRLVLSVRWSHAYMKARFEVELPWPKKKYVLFYSTKTVKVIS